MGSAVAFTAFTYALKHLPASKVMTYAYVNPIIAVFAGAAAGRIGLVPPEPIVLPTLVGMVVIVAGVALTTTAPTLPPSDRWRAGATRRRAAGDHAERGLKGGAQAAKRAHPLHTISTGGSFRLQSP